MSNDWFRPGLMMVAVRLVAAVILAVATAADTGTSADAVAAAPAITDILGTGTGIE